jgi:hypothetical protein
MCSDCNRRERKNRLFIRQALALFALFLSHAYSSSSASLITAGYQHFVTPALILISSSSLLLLNSRGRRNTEASTHQEGF